MRRLVRSEIDRELELDSAAESSLQKNVDCQRHFRNLRGGSPSRGDLYDGYACYFTVPDLAHFDHGVIAFLSVYITRRGRCRSSEPQGAVMCNQCWLAAAVSLAILGWLHLLNPYLILIGNFFIGIGFAFNAPTRISSAAQIVSDAELPSSGALNGLQFDVSGYEGAVIGTSSRWNCKTSSSPLPAT
jgi:Transmembrane secretion effector